MRSERLYLVLLLVNILDLAASEKYLRGSVNSFALTNDEAAEALTNVLGGSSWKAIAIARGYLALHSSSSEEEVADIIRSHGRRRLASGKLSGPIVTGKESKELVQQLGAQGFLATLEKRKRTGSAENPVTKLFPAVVTEQRFERLIKGLCSHEQGLDYVDDRDSGNLSDFTLVDQRQLLPINVKNAGTRFEQAQKLVGLAPDDCIPIPAYKANGALVSTANLLYAVSPDYELLRASVNRCHGRRDGRPSQR